MLGRGGGPVLAPRSGKGRRRVGAPDPMWGFV